MRIANIQSGPVFSSVAEVYRFSSDTGCILISL